LSAVVVTIRAFFEGAPERGLVRPIAGQRRGDGVLHRHRAAQPALSQLRIAADDIVRAGERPTANQPCPPAGREIPFDRLEKEITAASGLRLPSGATWPSKPENRHRPRRARIGQSMTLGDVDQRAAHPATG
jgi:hypothetical protein